MFSLGDLEMKCYRHKSTATREEYFKSQGEQQRRYHHSLPDDKSTTIHSSAGGARRRWTEKEMQYKMEGAKEKEE